MPGLTPAGGSGRAIDSIAAILMTECWKCDASAFGSAVCLPKATLSAGTAYAGSINCSTEDVPASRAKNDCPYITPAADAFPSKATKLGGDDQGVKMGGGAEQRILQTDRSEDLDVKKAKGAECKVLQAGSTMSASHLAACRSIYQSLIHKGLQPETIPLYFCGPMGSDGLNNAAAS